MTHHQINQQFAQCKLLVDLVMRHKDIIKSTLQNTQKITERISVAVKLSFADHLQTDW